MASNEVSELRRRIGQLRRCVGTLRTQYGDTAQVRRLANDVDRLDIDAGDLPDPPPIARQRGGEPGEADVVQVPDTPYDDSLWHGADDEGVGGYRPQVP